MDDISPIARAMLGVIDAFLLGIDGNGVSRYRYRTADDPATWREGLLNAPYLLDVPSDEPLVVSWTLH
jgi:hypothetical protein